MNWDIVYGMCAIAFMGSLALSWCWSLSKRVLHLEKEAISRQKLELDDMKNRYKIYKNSPPSE